MSDYILDGELHALTDKIGYAIKVLEEDLIFDSKDPIFTKEVSEMAGKYNSYLEKGGKDPIKKEDIFLNTRNVHFVYRPSQSYEGLIQKATLAIKFVRFENDGLDATS